MKTSSIFDPLSMGALRFKNRIALAPMTRARAGAARVPNESRRPVATTKGTDSRRLKPRPPVEGGKSKVQVLVECNSILYCRKREVSVAIPLEILMAL